MAEMSNFSSKPYQEKRHAEKKRIVLYGFSKEDDEALEDLHSHFKTRKKQIKKTFQKYADLYTGAVAQ